MKKKILLIGPGLIGHKHAKIIFENEELQLDAIVTPNIDKYKELGEKYSAGIYSDLEIALNERDFDGVVVSSPNQFHFEQAKVCIEHGIPTLLEKPLTSKINEAKYLVELAEEKSVPFLVGDHRLYNSLLYTAKKFIMSNQFGDIVSFDGSAQFYKPAHYFKEGPWRSKRGGGPILINLIHEIGIMRVLCGDISRVSAFSSNKVRGFEVEDTVAVNIEFLNGALGTFMLSDTAASNKSWEMTTGENPAYPSYTEDMSYHIAGTKASLDFPNMKVRMYENPSKASWWKSFTDGRLTKEYGDPLRIQMNHFSKVIQGLEEPISTARNGYMNMLVIEAIQRSIKEEKFIDLFT